MIRRASMIRTDEGRKLAVILGNEGEGLENETIIKLCDYGLKLMTHGVDFTRNVAAASAVAFWQLGKIIL